jgi:hypothetical protein
MIVGLLAACNTAPVGWPLDGTAPGAEAPWFHPSDDKCLAMADPYAFEVDGYLFCGLEAGERKIPIDDPIYEPCDGPQTNLESTRVVTVFDGLRARAWPKTLLDGRELVNDWWGDEPLLVDW